MPGLTNPSEKPAPALGDKAISLSRHLIYKAREATRFPELTYLLGTAGRINDSP